MKSLYRLFNLFFILGLVFFISCEEDEEAAPDPVAAFTITESSTLQAGEEVTFDASTSENAVTFTWSFGDGNSDVGQVVTHTYETAGEYTVTLEASVDGNRNVATQTITIAPAEEEPPVADELYFIDNTELKVRKISLDNPGVVTDVFDLPGFSFGLAYDDTNDHLYYSDDDNLKLFRNNLEGTDEVEIASGFGSIRDIALDIANNRLFVADRGAGVQAIIEVDLTDNSTSIVYDSASDDLGELPEGVDFFNGQLYVTCVEIDAETIWKGSTDGSGISNIIDYSAGGYGYAVEIDETNQKIYFDNTDGGEILSANLDGSGISSVGTTTDRVYGIAIDGDGGKFYWSSRDGMITSANLDGSGESAVLESDSDIRGMILKKGS